MAPDDTNSEKNKTVLFKNLNIKRLRNGYLITNDVVMTEEGWVAINKEEVLDIIAKILE